MSLRFISQCGGVWLGPTPSTGAHFSSGNSGANLIQQLQRVQSVSYSENVTRQDINQFGQLAAIDRSIIDPPTVSLDVTYLLADLSNERKLGFYTSGDSSAIQSILNQTQSERNYFIGQAPEGVNAFGYTGQMQVHQITNASVASYSLEASVGQLPTATISVQGLNFAGSTGSILQELKAINPVDGQVVPGRLFTLPAGTSGLNNTVAAIQPGSINVTISSDPLGVLYSDLKPQSFSTSFDFSLETLQKLGSRFGFARLPQFPVTCNASITADVGQFQTGDLSQIFCRDSSFNILATFADPACAGTAPIAFYVGLTGVKSDSQEFSLDLTSNANVTLSYSVQLGAATDQNGLYMSGRAW